MPIKGSNTSEAKGSPIKWGKKVDDLFLEASLPEGWKKVATDHAMWANLVDAQSGPNR